jgi:hypothetical protein
MKPAFAVVGHPNKGKSSIVSTIARDDSLAISAQSGTTEKVQAIPVEVGSSQFTLYDTPGFQRPTRVLAWLQERASSADARADAVNSFIASEQCRKEFPEEVMLLEPIMAGAAILYVVDGSRPYGAEYEAEMEILRWTGQASMALINPIENEDHVGAWQQALGQYFRVVRVFNAMQADFDKLVSVLEAFSHIKEEWHDDIGQLIQAYKSERAEQLDKAGQLLAELLIRVCSCQVAQPVPDKSAAEKLKPILEKQFLHEVSTAEQQCHRKLRDLLHYDNLEYSVTDLVVPDELFDTEKWIVWGLNRKQLTTAAIMAGAATGAVVDVALAGSSLMLGALGGGLLGAASVWLGADQIAEFRLQGLPVGGYEARFGPVRNRNFPYVIIARFLFLLDALTARTHASRETVQVQEGDLAARIENLGAEQQRRLHSVMDRLSQQKPVEQLAASLKPLLQIRGIDAR